MTGRILPKKARVVPKNAKKVFSGEIFDIYQWQQKMYDGSFSIFEMAKRTDTVQVLGIVEGQIVVLNEKQPDGTKRAFGLPGGRIDPEDESPLHASRREMKEETGYSFKNWKLLNVHQPQRKIEWFIYVFVAWDVIEKTNQKIDVGEKIEVLTLPWNDYLNRGNRYTITENNLKNYKTINELVEAKEFNKENQ